GTHADAPFHYSADGLASDLHASAAYRANLISVMTQRAVTKALG
ncbi:MAG: carbon monoxide dehydrogenase, partial [Burkholderiaceae bacterium]